MINAANAAKGSQSKKVRLDRESYFSYDSKAVITSEWHLIVYGDGSVELYDRVKDPWALKNLAKRLPQVVAKLRENEWDAGCAVEE